MLKSIQHKFIIGRNENYRRLYYAMPEDLERQPIR